MAARPTKGDAVEIICDAPPYPIVQACSAIGVERPEDVRWSEVTHFLKEYGYQPTDPNPATWSALLKKLARVPLACPCGRDFPVLGHYRFQFDDGGWTDYLLGQCWRCKTVYWHKTWAVIRQEDD